MYFLSTTNLLTALSAAQVIHGDVLRCGTNNPSAELRKVHASHARIDAAERLAHPVRSILPRASRHEINTYVHVINTGQAEENGNIAQSKILQQIDILNQAYNTSGFSFVLNSTTRTTSAAWQNLQYQSSVEIAMKKNLRVGTYKDLNIYFSTLAPDGNGHHLLGYATFPAVNPNAQTFILDGALMSPDTAPGGPPPYNLGMTTVHEVGHWLGLLHPFNFDPDKFGPNTPQGCADTAGDHIFDTPAEKNASFGCQVSRDSCVGKSTSVQGRDPVHNYMDYSDDRCLNKFTTGQAKRMTSLFEELRLDYAGAGNRDQGKIGSVAR